MANTHSTRSLAFHAAAHCVVAHSMGRAVEMVDVSDHLTIDNMAPTNQFEALEIIVIKLAGVYAAARAGGSALLGGFSTGGLEDYAAATQIAAQIVDAGYARHADDVFRQAEWEIDMHLRQHWPRVQRVAAALQQRGGKLTAEEFATLYRR